jgi:hypothetical protein
MSPFKDTKFTATTYVCSGCGYRSLIKINTQNHVKAKCVGSAVTTENKLVSHFDEHESERFEATLYQCARCCYTTDNKGHSVRHSSSKKCLGVDMLCSKRVLKFEDAPKVTTIGGLNIVNNHGSAIGTLNLHLHFHHPGSPEEMVAIVKALTEALNPLGNATKRLLGSSPAELPFTISEITREIDPSLDNKYILNNDVVSRADPNAKTPKVKHSKKEALRLVNALYEYMKTPGVLKDWTEDDDPMTCYDIDDMFELRSKLLPLFYDETRVPLVHESLNRYLSVEQLGDAIVDAEEDRVFHECASEYYTLLKQFVEDPETFKRDESDLARDIRMSAKKYLESLPIEKKCVGRPSNDIV